MVQKVVFLPDDGIHRWRGGGTGLQVFRVEGRRLHCGKLAPRGTRVLTHRAAVKLPRRHNESRLKVTPPFLPDVETDLDVEGRLPDARPHLVVVARVEEPVQDSGNLDRDQRRVM